MQYTLERLDRATGHLVSTNEEWKTIREVGASYGLGPRQTRAILHHMGLLHWEGDRYRLTPLAIHRGQGRRIDHPKMGYPFDVVSPQGQALIAEVWDTTVADYEAGLCPALSQAAVALERYKKERASRGASELGTQGEVHWLYDNWQRRIDTGEMTYSEIPSHDAIAKVVGVSQQLVSRYASRREKGLTEAKAVRRVLSKVSVTGARYSRPVDRAEIEGTWVFYSSTGEGGLSQAA